MFSQHQQPQQQLTLWTLHTAVVTPVAVLDILHVAHRTSGFAAIAKGLHVDALLAAGQRVALLLGDAPPVEVLIGVGRTLPVAPVLVDEVPTGEAHLLLRGGRGRGKGRGGRRRRRKVHRLESGAPPTAAKALSRTAVAAGARLICLRLALAGTSFRRSKINKAKLKYY